jgi:hypothetical protein
MAAATNEQVQQYADQRFRPRSEQLRQVYLAIKDDQQAFDDIYENLTNDPTWTDQRQDAPPHLLTPDDMLAYNTFMVRYIEFIEGALTGTTCNEAAGQWPVILSACVRPVEP